MATTPVSFKVEGGARLRRSLRSAGAEMEDFKEVHRSVAGIVLPAAIAATPVASGRLKSTVRASGTQGGVIIRAGNASVKYANVVHWWNTEGFHARPWVREAARATEPQWVARYFRGLEDILNKVEGV